MRKSLLGLFLVFLAVSVTNVVAQSLTDSRGDLLDKNGSPATGEPYLDILEANLVADGSTYVGTIKLDGDIPSKTSDSSIFIEWDFMIDADKNPSTCPWGSWPLVVNDIGVDYMVRLCLIDDNRYGQVYDGRRDSVHYANSQVKGNEIRLTFSPSDIGESTNFDFVVLVRKYGNRGAPDALIVFDKAPDKGHYTFQAGVVTVQTTRPLELPNLSMEFAHATAYYNQGSEERAKDIGEAFEYAHTYLQQDFPKVPPKFKIYVYRTQDDLVEGLIKISGAPPSEANFFKYGGAPRPLNYIMHVSPQFNWHAVAHELTHTFIEEYSGRAYLNIKWLDEGLAQYEAWKCVSTNPMHSQEEESFRVDALKTFNELKSRNALYPLNELTTDQQWGKEMTAGNSDYIYSQAYLVVSYLVSSYGIDQTKSILKEVQKGAKASEAVETVLEKTQTEILDEFKNAPESVIFGITYTTTATAMTSSSTEVLTTTRSAEEAIAIQPSTDLILVGGIITVIAAVGVIAALYRKKRSHAQTTRSAKG